MHADDGSFDNSRIVCESKCRTVPGVVSRKCFHSRMAGGTNGSLKRRSKNHGAERARKYDAATGQRNIATAADYHSAGITTTAAGERPENLGQLPDAGNCSSADCPATTISLRTRITPGSSMTKRSSTRSWLSLSAVPRNTTVSPSTETCGWPRLWSTASCANRVLRFVATTVAPPAVN